jgi:putative ATP-binding cassette transporter
MEETNNQPVARRITRGEAGAGRWQDGRHRWRGIEGGDAIWRIYCWQLMRLTLMRARHLDYTRRRLAAVSPKYLAGTMTLGEVVQAAAAFVFVQGAFNWFTDNYARLAEWASSANRVASLLLALDQMDGKDEVAGGTCRGSGNVRLPTLVDVDQCDAAVSPLS